MIGDSGYTIEARMKDVHEGNIEAAASFKSLFPNDADRMAINKHLMLLVTEGRTNDIRGFNDFMLLVLCRLAIAGLINLQLTMDMLEDASQKRIARDN